MPSIRTLLILSVFATAAHGAAAAGTDPRNEAIQSCAEALAEVQGARSYEIIDLSTLPGRADWRFWLNGNDAAVGGYCEIDRGRVARVVPLDSRWSEGRTRVPEVALVSAAD